MAGYLCRIRKALLWSGIALFSFGLVFYLYEIPWEVVSYAGLLALVPGLVLLIFDFDRYYKHHRMLERIYQSKIPVPERLPEPGGLLEEDYQMLVNALYQDKLRKENELENLYQDLLDYYTLWVHQIKTPIAAMNLLLQSEDTKANRELGIELFKIEQYTAMVLQYLRLESSSSDFLLQPYSMDDMIRQAVRKYARLFAGSGIALDFQETHLKVLTDEKWLVFVLEQILSNALKYTRKGTISVYRQSGNRVVIRDTGIGISAEDLPRVFEKGYTGYNGRMDKKATGLGLYLCKRIMDKLGHGLEIASRPDEGTEVVLTLTLPENSGLTNL